MKRLFFSLHRISGTIIALFFFMWFVSGLVLLYHPYPRLSDQQIYSMQELLPDSLPDIRSYLKNESGDIKNIRIRQFQDQTLISYSTNGVVHTVCSDTTQVVKPVNFDAVRTVAERWIDAPIRRVDTLHQREQWVLYSRYERVLPIYRFYFDDPERHELFISGKTGEAQQLTDATSRFWAWVGAIPHKFYLPFIRRDLTWWKTSITIGGLFCLIAALTGLYIGITVLIKRHKKQKTWSNPYRKRWYRWHYVTGLIFGIFLIAWGISGLVSMQRIPQWIIPMEGDYLFNASQMWGKKSLPFNAYRLDYRKLREVYPALKEVNWTHFRDIPVYRIIEGNRERLIDASATNVKPLFLPEETIIAGIRQIHGSNTVIGLSLMNHYDNYYLSRNHSLPLPVYKVNLDNNDRTLYYISPETGYVRYLNTNKKVKKWLFSGIHYLNIQWLIERPLLWTIAIWTLCLGGALVSLSGIWLGRKYLKRLIKK